MNIGNSGTLGRWVTARHMALAGYITKIIMIETGLTYKQVRRLYQIWRGTDILWNENPEPSGVVRH